MDPRERADDPQEAMRAALDGRQSQIWTAGPGIIQSFDPDEMTCSVQPAIQARVAAPDGSLSWKTLPLLVDCPVQFPGGGGASLTFKVSQGDECLVVFSHRCIDGWWYSGGVQPQLEARMHDLSDGFVLLGVRSRPRVLADISTTSTQLRSDDGLTLVDLNPTTKAISIIAPGGLTATTPKFSVSGNISAGTGVTGSFSTPTGQTVTVQNGIVTNIF